jgi:predicted site-specific integrase-resolvase
VSGHGQKSGLGRQKQALGLFCSQNGWAFEAASDLGTGMDCHKKGLAKLLSAILAGGAGRIATAHKGRLLRLGAEPVFSICVAKNVEAATASKGGEPPFGEGLASGALETATALSARLYGPGSKKSKKLLEGAAKAAAGSAEGAQNKDMPKQRTRNISSENMRDGAVRL